MRGEASTLLNNVGALHADSVHVCVLVLCLHMLHGCTLTLDSCQAKTTCLLAQQQQPQKLSSSFWNVTPCYICCTCSQSAAHVLIEAKTPASHLLHHVLLATGTLVSCT
jgi:hypothetical protein